MLQRRLFQPRIIIEATVIELFARGVSIRVMGVARRIQNRLLSVSRRRVPTKAR